MKTKLANDNLLYTKWFITLILGSIGLLFTLLIDETIELKPIVYITSLLLVSFGIVYSQLKSFIELDNNKLVVSSELFGIMKIAEYEICKMEDLSFQKNVKSTVYTSSSEVKVMGIDVTPESEKNYYHHKELITFFYEGRKVEIGKWKKQFGAQTIVEMILNRNNM